MNRAHRPTTPWAIVRILIENRILARRLAAREIQAEFRGTTLGWAWVIVQPILMLFVYWFVFKFVLGAKWQMADLSNHEFALVLFCGLIVFGIFSDCIGRSPNLLMENSAYIKKVVFPLEILPWVVLIRALSRAGIAFGVLLFAHVILIGMPPATVFLLPLVVLPLCFLCLGLSWFLASLGLFVRDIPPVITLALNALMFLSPVFYPVQTIPEKIRWIFMLNPLSGIIEMTRDVMLWGRMPDPVMLSALAAVGIICAWLGLLWFEKTRKGFADVV